MLAGVAVTASHAVSLCHSNSFFRDTRSDKNTKNIELARPVPLGCYASEKPHIDGVSSSEGIADGRVLTHIPVKSQAPPFGVLYVQPDSRKLHSTRTFVGELRAKTRHYSIETESEDRDVYRQTVTVE